MLYPLSWFSSFIASAVRLGAGKGGVSRTANGAVPILYEFEACPFCKIAREAISEAGISVLVRPCPKGGKRFRPMVMELGGKAQFPYLVDGETRRGMYESADIARDMRDLTGTSRPLVHWVGPLNVLLAQYAILFRFMSGMGVKASIPNEKPLAFSGIERHPSARLVKERLCSMELEYVWHTGMGEGVRLSDPNTGNELVGGKAILEHLDNVYRPRQ